MKRKASYPALRLAVLCLVLGSLFALSIVTIAADASGFEAATKEAQRLFDTPEGHDYVQKFSMKGIGKSLYDVLDACTDKIKAELACDIVFIVSADGHIERTLFGPKNAFESCVAGNLRLPPTVPPRPREAWPVQIHLVNRPGKSSNEPFVTIRPAPEASATPPVDTPRKFVGDQADNYEKAIAPFVAKARATYPAAKKRFLAGLPQRYKFYITARLHDERGNFEDSFITVVGIKNGKIDGIIASDLTVVSGFKTADHLTVPENEILDWTIERPDGSEEGNFVGKFMDRLGKLMDTPKPK